MAATSGAMADFARMPTSRKVLLFVVIGLLIGFLYYRLAYKGLKESVVVGRHALRNAMIPIITVLGLDFGAYLTGSILTETIFSWPGLGRYVVNAIARRDLPAIQGSVLFLSAVFVLVNLLTDLAYAKADPRVTYA